MKKYGIVGAAVSVGNVDTLFLHQAFGYENLELKSLAKTSSTFHLASITKVVTAISVLQLWEHGKINLDAPIQLYLTDFNPEAVKDNNPITIRHLLSHTSGLTDDINEGSYCIGTKPRSCIIEELNREVLNIAPGLKKNYSNAGYSLLGCLIERVSGSSYTEYVRQHVLAPLGIRDSWSPDGKQVATGYSKDSIPESDWKMRDIAAGGLACSLDDLEKLTQVFLSNGYPLLKPETFSEMCSNQLEGVALKADEEFGLGVFIKWLGTDKDALIGPGYGHAGDLINHHALIMSYPQLPLKVVIMTNSENGARFANALTIQIIKSYFELMRGEEVGRNEEKEFSAVALEADPIDHDLLTGTYGGGGSDFIRITRKSKNKLRFIQDGNVLVLKRDSDNTYKTRFILFKVLPIPFKALKFAFTEYQGDYYLKALMAGTKTAEYISKKDPDDALSQSWLNAAGAYIPDPSKNAGSCGVMTPYLLKTIGNKIVLYRFGRTDAEQDEIGFNALNSLIAVADGIDRGAGSTLRILPDDRLYFSGFDLIKVSDLDSIPERFKSKTTR